MVQYNQQQQSTNNNTNTPADTGSVEGYIKTVHVMKSYRTNYGEKFNIGITVDGVQGIYNLCYNLVGQDVAIDENQLVRFTFKKNDKGLLDIDKPSIKPSMDNPVFRENTQSRPTQHDQNSTSGNPPQTTNSNPATQTTKKTRFMSDAALGATVGQSMNAATQLYAVGVRLDPGNEADKSALTAITEIKKMSLLFIAVGEIMNSAGYEKLVGDAGKLIQELKDRKATLENFQRSADTLSEIGGNSAGGAADSAASRQTETRQAGQDAPRQTVESELQQQQPRNDETPADTTYTNTPDF